MSTAENKLKAACQCELRRENGRQPPHESPMPRFVVNGPHGQIHSRAAAQCGDGEQCAFRHSAAMTAGGVFVPRGDGGAAQADGAKPTDDKRIHGQRFFTMSPGFLKMQPAGITPRTAESG